MESPGRELEWGLERRVGTPFQASVTTQRVRESKACWGKTSKLVCLESRVGVKKKIQEMSWLSSSVPCSKSPRLLVRPPVKAHKGNQPMNAQIGGTTNLALSPPIPSSLSKIIKRNTKTKTRGISMVRLFNCVVWTSCGKPYGSLRKFLVGA